MHMPFIVEYHLLFAINCKVLRYIQNEKIQDIRIYNAFGSRWIADGMQR